MMLKTLLLSSLIYLAACSTPNVSGSFSPKLVDENSAIVYIYRPSSMSNAIYTPELFVNDEYKLSIKNGQNYHVFVSPGETSFEIAPDENYSGQTQLKLTLIAGQSYFIRVDSSLKIPPTTTYKAYQRSFDLLNVDEKSAISQIEQCCSADTKNSPVSSSPINTQTKTKDGFSVDKTQNPFSH